MNPRWTAPMQWSVLSIAAAAWLGLTAFISYWIGSHFDLRSSLREYTPWLIPVVMILLGLLDVMLYKIGGNPATFSATMLESRVKHPYVGWATAYTLCVFLGHVFFPSPWTVVPATHEVLSRFVLGCAPTFAAMITFASGDGQAVSQNLAVTDPVNQLKYAGVMEAFMLAGLLVGRFVLKQHPLAPGV